MNQVIINGHTCLFEEGQTILQLLHKIGLEIPSLCYDERMHPLSVCRTCMVKIKGNDRWQPSCRTLLTNGMEIETHLPELEEYRKGILQMLANKYPLTLVANHPQVEFHRWLLHYGITNKMERVASEPIDMSHPYIKVDMSRCIKCFRCVNICDNVQGQFVWHVINSADKTKVISDSKGLFVDSSCVSCGACADTCPTGAIEDQNVIRFGMPEKVVKTVCAYCGVGCEIEAGVKDNALVNIKPAKDAPVNKGHLCVKGRYAWEYINAKERVTHPMIRGNGGWKIVSWDEALRYCAQRLSSISEQYGADSIGVIGSARATNEDNYLIQKFARTVIGTNNVDNCARVCHQPTAKAMSMMLGTGAATNSFDDIENAHTLLIVGANATTSHPVVGARIKQMALAGANLIVIDPRKIELAAYARYHLQLRPGTNIPLLHAIAQVIISEDLYDHDFVEHRTEGWEEFKKVACAWTPEKAAKVCHVHPRLIREAARLYAKEKPSICFHGLGMTEHVQGTEGVMALVNLALLTGNMGKPGTGINPLRGQNNVQGVAMMGCDPAVYTGLVLIKNEKARFEQLWQSTLPKSHGLNLPEMLDAAAKGDLKSMYIVGYDVFFTMPNSRHSESAFKGLHFLVIQDMFLNETASRFADVFLPAATSFEKEGTFMNAERRIQKLRKVIAPPQNVKADWEIVCSLAAAMGKQELFKFSNPKEIWNEIRSVWSAVYGITYERLEQGGIQWPCPDIHHPGTAILHSETFPIGDRAKLSPVDYKPTSEHTSADYPFILITGRELYHFNAGTMTYRTPNKKIRNSDFLHLHPMDADVAGLKEGDNARLISRYGEASLPVHIDPDVRRGEVFTTFSNNKVFINQLTSSVRDNYVQTPEYKITAIRIEKVTDGVSST